MKISKAVGIDLGTTNSVISMVGKDNKSIICRTDKRGQKTFPSVLFYDKRSSEFKVGRTAFNARGTANDPIVSIKSHMGDSSYTVTTGGKTMTPIEVSAEILRSMKNEMQEQLSATPGYENYVVDRAVITIPAYFGSNAREATTKAGELAGLQVEFTLQEPTSSALYYCQKSGIESGIFMVYDLGGGTFDVSIVQYADGDPHVVGIAGDNYLGGDNFDAALAKHLLKLLQEDEESGYALDLDIHNNPEDKRSFQRLKLVAENIKKQLSFEDEYYVEHSGIFNDKNGAAVNLDATITRAEFEDLIRPLLISTLDECRKALAEAEEKFGITLDKIDGVLLVGGSTHVPLVSQIIEETFTNPSLPLHTKLPKPLIDDPDMAVGYGAAIAASGLGIIELPGEGELKNEDGVFVSPQIMPANGYGGESTVTGQLHAHNGSLPEAITATVINEAQSFREEYPVAADGKFVFDGLIAENDPEMYHCVFEAGGSVIAECDFDAYPSENTHNIPVTLSRNYYLQVFDEQTETKKLQLLMECGLELPITREFTFKTNSSNRFFANFNFFEENKELKSVSMDFANPVAPGTSIRMYLSCNKKSIFSGYAESMDGTKVDFEFKASEMPPLPEMTDVEKAIKDAFDSIEDSELGKGKKLIQQQKVKRLEEEIQEAIGEGDAVKANDRLEKLQEIGQHNKPKEQQLTPEKSAFMADVDAVISLNNSLNRKTGAVDYTNEINDAMERGLKAYDNEDQDALTFAHEKLSKIKEAIHHEQPDGNPGQQEAQEAWMEWMQIAVFALNCIDNALQKDDLTASFKEKYLRPEDVAADRNLLNRLGNELYQCHPEKDEVESKYKTQILPIAKKWLEICQLCGVPTSGVNL